MLYAGSLSKKNLSHIRQVKCLRHEQVKEPDAHFRFLGPSGERVLRKALQESLTGDILKHIVSEADIALFPGLGIVPWVSTITHREYPRHYDAYAYSFHSATVVDHGGLCLRLLVNPLWVIRTPQTLFVLRKLSERLYH